MLGRILKMGFLGLAGATFVLSLGCAKDEEGGEASQSAPSTWGPKTATQLATPIDFLNLVSSSLDVNWKVYGDNNFRTDFANYRAALPQFGDSSMLTNSSRLFTNFGYTLCSYAFDQERNSTKRVFRFINLNVGPQIATGQQSEAQVKAFLTHLAARFWGRAPTGEELADIYAMYLEHVRLQIADGSPGVGAPRTEEVVEYVCAALASSTQTLLRAGRTL